MFELSDSPRCLFVTQKEEIVMMGMTGEKLKLKN